jgi:hypothetical protein
MDPTVNIGELIWPANVLQVWALVVLCITFALLVVVQLILKPYLMVLKISS